MLSQLGLSQMRLLVRAVGFPGSLESALHHSSTEGKATYYADSSSPNCTQSTQQSLTKPLAHVKGASIREFGST